MAVKSEIKNRFFTALTMLLLLMMLPVRVETAETSTAMLLRLETAVSLNALRHNFPYTDFIARNINLSAFMTKDRPESFLENVFSLSGFNVRSCMLDSIFQLPGQSDETDIFSLETLSAGIHPLVEISYSISSRIALEVRGHFNRYTVRTPGSSTSDDEHYEYTFFFGPSYYTGTPDDSTRMYTQFGIGYNVINDSESDIFSKDCPTSFGTGFSLGLRGKASDIRIGYNYFNQFSDTSLHTGRHEKIDPSSVFLFVTYNFDM